MHQVEELLKSVFESQYAGGDFIAWLEEEATSPLALSFKCEARQLLEHYSNLGEQLIMSNSKFTPGPWYHVGGTDNRKAPFIRAVGDAVPGTMAIASVCNRGSYWESQANARLIAAAPELLEALQTIMSKQYYTILPSEWDKARAAIQKALGEC